jgi:hypothetical protein
VLDGLYKRFVTQWCRESVEIMEEIRAGDALVKRPNMRRGFVNGGIES